jgi:hypothetical protein
VIPDYWRWSRRRDGYPGIPRIGAVGAARLLNRTCADRGLTRRRCSRAAPRREGCCSRTCHAAQRTPRCRDADALHWRGPTPAFAAGRNRI